MGTSRLPVWGQEIQRSHADPALALRTTIITALLQTAWTRNHQDFFLGSLQG